MRVMVVDDSTMMQRAISDWVSQMGHEVVGYAGDGEEAVSKFEELKPDVVTLDITMPKMDGLEALQKMRAISETVKIIIVSAQAQKSTALKALEIGADSYLTKPVNREDLIDVFDEVFG